MTGIPDTIYIYAEAWSQLYNAFGERMQDEELEIMDAIFNSIVADEQERVKWLSEQEEAE